MIFPTWKCKQLFQTYQYNLFHSTMIIHIRRFLVYRFLLKVCIYYSKCSKCDMELILNMYSSISCIPSLLLLAEINFWHKFQVQNILKMLICFRSWYSALLVLWTDVTIYCINVSNENIWLNCDILWQFKWKVLASHAVGVCIYHYNNALTASSSENSCKADL